MNKKLLLSFVLFFLLAAPLFSAKNFTIYNSTNPTQAYFFIDGTVGNVGIGTQNALQKLHVVGDILANGTITSTTDLCIQGGNCLSNTGSMSSFILGGTSGTNQTISNGNVAFIAAGTAITTTAAATDRVIISVADNSIGNSQLAYDTGQHLTTSSSPTFSALTVSTINTGSGAMKLGDAAVANGDTNSIPTGDQVYDFVIGLGYGSGSVTGAGTTGYLTRWNGTTSLNSSVIYENGSRLGFDTTAPQAIISLGSGTPTGTQAGTPNPWGLYLNSSYDASFNGYTTFNGPVYISGAYLDNPLGYFVDQNSESRVALDYNNAIFTRMANRWKNHDHGSQTNPTIFVHSATDPDVSNTQWTSITHNTTGAVYNTGTGPAFFTSNVVSTGTVSGTAFNTGSGNKYLGDAAVANGDTNSIPTGDQVYDFVIGLGYGKGSVVGAGTSGYLTRWNGTTSLNSSVIYESGNDIGIGTTTPGAHLEVAGTGAQEIRINSTDSATAAISLMRVGASYVDWRMINNGANLFFEKSSNDGSSWLTLFFFGGSSAYEGRLGIGTSIPQQKLHVVGDILANGTITSTTDLCIQGGNCLSNTGSMSSFILGGTSGTNQTISNGNVAFIAAGTAITTTAAATDRVIISVADNSIGNSQLAYDTGQHLTTSSSPTFSALTVSTINTGSGAMKLGDAAVANGDTNSIPTGDQVYDFVIGLGYGKGSVTGAGTTGYIPMWNGTTSQNNSMIFQNSTTVGIGYTGYSSTYELYVYGEAYASSYMRVGGDYLLDGGDIYDPSGDLHILAEDNLYLKTDYNNNDANYRAIIFAKDTTTSTVPTENNVLMSVNETGRVGINTSFANYTLHVYGNAYTSSSLGSGGSIYSANDIYTTGSDDDLWLGTSAQTSSRMRLYATGDLIANGTINAYDIRINGSVIGGGGGGAGNITGGGTANYIPRWTNASHLGNSLISQSSSVVYIGSSSSGLGVYTNGSIYDINEDKLTVLDALNVTGNNVTAKAFVYWSDARLKDNITVLKDSLAKVKQLEGVTFDWKDSGKHTIGLIAQDVEEVFPEAVSGEGEDFRYLEYGSLIAPIIESIKELDKKNERQDLEIQELKEEIELLKLQIATLSENQPCNLSEGLIVQYDVPVVEKEKSTLYKYFYVLLSRMF